MLEIKVSLKNKSKLEKGTQILRLFSVIKQSEQVLDQPFLQDLEEATETVKSFTIQAEKGLNKPFLQELHKATQILRLFSTIKQVEQGLDKPFLQERMFQTLLFYFIYGYSEETKELIMASLGIKPSNLSKINSKLFQQKLLKRGVHNTRKGELNSELLGLKKALLESKEPTALKIIFQ